MTLVVSLLAPGLSLLAVVIVIAVFRAHRARTAPVATVSLGRFAVDRLGPVKVTGTIRADQWKLINARFTGRPGVVAVAERWKTGPRRSRRLDRDLRWAGFSIDDGTGRARLSVDFADCLVDLAPVDFDPLKRGPRPDGELREAVLVPGDRVTVIGTLRRRRDGGLELFGTPDHRLLVSAS